MNAVNLIGNLCKDWNIHNGNTTSAKNTLAVRKDYKRDESDFINIVAFGKSAELLEQYTGKGSKIAIQGRINTGSYEKEGRTIYTTDVVVDKFEFLDSKKTGEAEAKEMTEEDFENNDENVDDDEFPF